MYQTGYQRLCGVVRVIGDLQVEFGREATSQARVVAIYQEKATSLEKLIENALAAGSSDNKDKHAESFARECFSILDQFLSVPGVADAIKRLDAKLVQDNPLDSVYKLGYIRRRARGDGGIAGNHQLQWVVLALTDNLLNGVEAVQHIGVNDL